jgi:Icc-related predicted phosphoesterase
MADPHILEAAYTSIPDETDIIVSHQPPFGYGDKVLDRYTLSEKDIVNDGHVGSKELLATIERVRPKAVICGHIHSGYGSYRFNDTMIYNVALVDESYQLTNQPTEIIIEGV